MRPRPARVDEEIFPSGQALSADVPLIYEHREQQRNYYPRHGPRLRL